MVVFSSGSHSRDQALALHQSRHNVTSLTLPKNRYKQVHASLGECTWVHPQVHGLRPLAGRCGQVRSTRAPGASVSATMQPNVEDLRWHGVHHCTLCSHSDAAHPAYSYNHWWYACSLLTTLRTLLSELLHGSRPRVTGTMPHNSTNQAPFLTNLRLQPAHD